MTKPPLGLTPKEIHDDGRLFQIVEAMGRYLNVRKSIPVEWLNEYNEFTKPREISGG